MQILGICNYGNVSGQLATNLKKTFKQILKKYFGHLDEILNQTVGMFYTNFVVSLYIKNTSWKTQGKMAENL